MNSNHAYTLYVKGVEQKMYNPYDTRLWFYRFVPQRFAVLGSSEARSGGNPAGQALGSITSIKLFSTKTSAQFGLSLPLGVSVAWESQNRVRVIQSKPAQ